MLHLEVKQVVREFANEAVKTSDDAGLVERMTQRIRALAQDEAPLEDGGVERRPAVDVRPQDVAWERLPGDQLHVAFEYDRELALPFVQRRMPRHFSVDLTLDVTRAQWGSTR
jgi:hypothetical protein